MQHGFMDYYHLRLYNVSSADLIRKAKEEKLAQEADQLHREGIADAWQAKVMDWLAGVWLALFNHEEHADQRNLDDNFQHV